VKDCPEIKDLAHFLESGEGSADLTAHLGRCDACQEARKSLEDEAMSLQISISELWFREQISCPDSATLERYRKRQLGAEEQAYVSFHLKTLLCRTCEARQDEAELLESVEARGGAARSKRKVTDASMKLIGEMKKGKGR
jgi:hypothetical protein